MKSGLKRIEPSMIVRTKTAAEFLTSEDGDRTLRRVEAFFGDQWPRNSWVYTKWGAIWVRVTTASVCVHGYRPAVLSGGYERVTRRRMPNPSSFNDVSQPPVAREVLGSLVDEDGNLLDYTLLKDGLQPDAFVIQYVVRELNRAYRQHLLDKYSPWADGSIVQESIFNFHTRGRMANPQDEVPSLAHAAKKVKQL